MLAARSRVQLSMLLYIISKLCLPAYTYLMNLNISLASEKKKFRGPKKEHEVLPIWGPHQLNF
jgi:hypothetical protein